MHLCLRLIYFLRPLDKWIKNHRVRKENMIKSKLNRSVDLNFVKKILEKTVQNCHEKNSFFATFFRFSLY